MKKEEFIRNMGLEAWNIYAVPARNGILGDLIGREKAIKVVYYEIILSALGSRGLSCTRTTLDEIMSKLSFDKRRKLKAAIKEKMDKAYQKYTEISDTS